jgi:DNA polymerase I-like protein with 3'-5' exonuclease and polymerase domains
MLPQLDHSSQIVIVVDERRTSSPDHHGLFSGWQWEFLRGKMLRAGISPESCQFISLQDVIDCQPISLQGLIVGLGERTLRHFTDKKGIDKWQLSPLTAKSGQKFIPAYDLGRIQKQYELGLYLELALRRAASESLSPVYEREPERFLINPGIEETLAVLDRIKHEEEIAVDVETGYGQINTVGFAWSGSDAIAINVLPDRCGDYSYYELWKGIAAVLSSGSRKIFQNFIYDVSYFSAYGVRVGGPYFDTMWAMKVLWPELKSNLGNVGRIYTDRVYWKDDGKVTDEESGRRDWGAIRDWTRHYLYNCRDTTGTLVASRAQRRDLDVRGLRSFFDGYIMRLAEPILEMCSNGMPLSGAVRERLKVDSGSRVEELTRLLHEQTGMELNPNSPKQVTNYLKGLGVALPKKYDREKGESRETTDASAIKKIRLKHPEILSLATLVEIKELRTALSRYINFEARPDGRLSYSLNGCGTETLRWSGNKDAWDRGFNIQTVPREGGSVSIKSMFVAPEGYSFVEVDLRQAESRFVAYDAADSTLIDMLESGADVHSHVGNAILRQMGKDPSLIPRDEFKSTWRQLGKKAGHGLNYGMKPGVFVETVFSELDLVIKKKDAELITQAYYGLFPGIPRWHSWLRSELYNKRKLTTPFGWERYFYGRPGPDMDKEGFAFRPQSTIPYITNQLMLHLCNTRKCGDLEFQLLVQCHDSLISLVPDGFVGAYARVCLQTEVWHPAITLAGGRMVIPTEVKYGRSMDNLREYIEGELDEKRSDEG